MRCTIIHNASLLRPRPDCFLPNILLGFFDKDLHLGRSFPWQLQYVPASNHDTALLLPSSLFSRSTNPGVYIDGKLYCEPLSSRDGFLLLGEDNCGGDNLCLYVLATGTYTVLPAAAFSDHSVRCMYVLATGYDIVDDGDKTAVWILAVHCLRDSKDGVTYQIFSSKSGEWGPVKLTEKFPDDVANVYTDQNSPRGAVVVFHGAVSWFVHLCLDPDKALDRRIRKCLFSMDLRTERTWTTELPEILSTELDSLVLAVSEDGRLCLVRMLSFLCQMEVWVLDGGKGSQWRRRWTIDDVQKLLPRWCRLKIWRIRLSGFCPRSGYLFGTIEDDRDPVLKLEQHFVIGVDGSSPRLIGAVESSSSAVRFPYEMDWSTYISPYISKMKYL